MMVPAERIMAALAYMPAGLGRTLSGSVTYSCMTTSGSMGSIVVDRLKSLGDLEEFVR